MAKHVMVDLETLSKRTNAAIVQLAAVTFDTETGEILSRFNTFVNESCLAGATVGHVDIGTVGWWLRQKAAPALGEALTSEDEACWLEEALGGFASWFDEQDEDGQDLGEQGAIEGVWSHGASFDLPILTAAFERCEASGYEVPWAYKLPRDTRTLYAVAPGGMPTVDLDESRKHDALYDCEVQVQQVCGALKALRDQAAAAEQTHAAESDLQASSTYPFANQEALNVYAEYQRGPSISSDDPAFDPPVDSTGLPVGGYGSI